MSLKIKPDVANSATLEVSVALAPLQSRSTASAATAEAAAAVPAVDGAATLCSCVLPSSDARPEEAWQQERDCRAAGRRRDGGGASVRAAVAATVISKQRGGFQCTQMCTSKAQTGSIEACWDA